MKRILSLVLCLLLIFSFCAVLAPFTAAAEEDTTIERRKTPLMGWASWNCFHTSISEDIILAEAQALVDLGLADLGYVFVNTDDGFQQGRDAEGYVQNNPETFPSGMRSLADNIHALGLKAGIYTDGGVNTCASIWAGLTANSECGLYGNEEKDLRRYFIDWDFDFIKVDWCGGLALNLDRQTQYTKIGSVIKEIENEVGKDKLYNVCSASFPGAWVTDVADSWRMTGDIFCDFDNVLSHVDAAKSLAEYTGPGHVNDLDMMEVGNGMTYDEDKSHFTLWCMMSTPLLIGTDLRSITPETLSILSNAELIALDQDPLCRQAHLIGSDGSVDFWLKELDSGEAALAFVNRSNSPREVYVDLESLGFEGVSVVRDLWMHSDLPYGDGLAMTLPAHGCECFRFEYTPGEDMPDPAENDDGSKVETEVSVEDLPSWMNLHSTGSLDWVHLSTALTSMPGGMGEITVDRRGTETAYTDGSVSYRYKTSEGTQMNLGKSGVRLSGENAAAKVTAECDSMQRTLQVSVGGYSADVNLRVYAGGKLISKTVLPGEKGKYTTKNLKISYQSDIPTELTVFWTVDKPLSDDAAVTLEFAAVSADPKQSLTAPPKVDYAGKITRVRYAAYTTEPLCLIVAVKDQNGAIISLKTHQTEKSKWLLGADTFSLGSSFAGNAEVYLWKNGFPVAQKRTLPLNTAAANNYFIGPLTARTMLKNGASLVDVRTTEEYESGHLEGALHLDYQEVGALAPSLIPDKDATYILYCSMAKRSAQALTKLRELGYNAVFTIGSMSNFDVSPQICYGAGAFDLAAEGEIPDVYCIGAGYDDPEILIAYGENASLETALPLREAKIPHCDEFYLKAKIYLTVGGVSYAEDEKTMVCLTDAGFDAYASDLRFVRSSCGWGSVHKDKSIDGHTLTLCGKTYKKGIGTHATSEIVVNIPEGMTKFVAVVGIDDETSGGQCNFSVIVDGVTLAYAVMQSGKMSVIDVDLPAGATQMTLYVDEAAGGNYCDHADWCIAGFKK